MERSRHALPVLCSAHHRQIAPAAAQLLQLRETAARVERSCDELTLRGLRKALGPNPHRPKLILLGACAFAVGSDVLSTACPRCAAPTIDRTCPQQSVSTR